MSETTDRLRDKAKDYELNALAQFDRGAESSAIGFFVASLVFSELANLFDEVGAEPLNETEAA